MFGHNQGGPSSLVELSFAARKLADTDVFSKSDPICIVFKAPADGCGPSREVGRTEMIKNCLNPDWNTKIRMEYFFESKQPLIFQLYDIDNQSYSLENQDFLGTAQCDLADIVAAPNGYLTLKLSGKPHVRGHLIVHADEIDQGQREVMVFRIQGQNLSKKSVFSKPDPFLEFFKFLPDGSRQLAFRSPIRRATTDPEWAQFEISVNSLCGSDKDKEFLIECLAYRSNGSHKFIGGLRISVNKLNGRSGLTIPLRNDKKGKVVNENSAPFGSLRFLTAVLRREYSFLEYISGGMQLEFGVSVDFTASNGPIHSSQSLHFVSGNSPNQYEMAIRSVLEICEHYNHSKIFDAVGFGAKVPPNYDVRHLFPLSINDGQRQLYGVDGILTAYRDCLNSTELYGPTNFEPTIQEFARKARNLPTDGSRYQILLIITDGVITDMAKTRAAIVDASDLPLSIIIVGVGNDDFDKMDQLDSDDCLLSANGRVAKRDIVQFVPFRNFFSPHDRNVNRAEVMARLAREVLAEVPEQVCSYMRSHGIAARPPPRGPLPTESFDSTTNNSVYPPLGSAPPPYPHTEPQPPANPDYFPSAAALKF